MSDVALLFLTTLAHNSPEAVKFLTDIVGDREWTALDILQETLRLCKIYDQKTYTRTPRPVKVFGPTPI